MYRAGSGGYGDRYGDDRYEGRHGNRDDGSGYRREREWGSRDDDRYGRYGESYSRDGDRYGRDNEERFGRDGYRDDDYRGRNQSTDDYNYGSRSRSADPERNRANEDDGQYSSRGSGAKADEQSQDGSYAGKKLENRYSGQSFDAPPSYEDSVGATQSPYNERDGESSQAYAPKASSPKDASPSHATDVAPHPVPASPPASASPPAAAQYGNQEVSGFDEFDPRGSFSAAPATSNGIAPATSAAEMDLLGSLSETFSSNSLALVPASQPYIASEADSSAGFNTGPAVGGASVPPTINNQPFDDPFGDGPFRAIASPDAAPTEQQINTSTFTANASHSPDVPQPVPQNAANYEATNLPPGPFSMQPTTSTPFPPQDSSTPSQDIDILADILPPSGPPSFVNAQTGPAAPDQSVSVSGFPPQTNQLALQSSLTGQNPPQNGFQVQNGQPAGFPFQLGQPSVQANYPPQQADSVSHSGFPVQTMGLALPLQAGQSPQLGFNPQSGSMQQPIQPNSNFYGAYQPQPVSTASVGGYMVPTSSTGLTTHQNFHPHSGSAVLVASNMSLQAPQVQSNSLVASKPSSDKFETKSTVWADTLSRGLVNLNISGSKTNPLADIGVDFDAINRKEKRMEKQPASTTVASTVSMGKAMGSGSGIGRAGAGALRPQPNPMMSSGMNFGMAGGPAGGMGMARGPGGGMGMAGGPAGGMGMSGGPAGGMGMNMGMGMDGYGGNQPIGRGMGMGMGMGAGAGMGMGTGVGMSMPGTMGMGMNMGMGMGQGTNMQQPMRPHPGSTIPGGYNPTMGAGNYGQQPYGGYR